MPLVDANLSELLKRLTPAKRRALESAIKGERTHEAGVILRWIKRRLKRRVRAGKKR